MKLLNVKFATTKARALTEAISTNILLQFIMERSPLNVIFAPPPLLVQVQ